MLSEVYYVVRSRTDGQYLVARPKMASEDLDRPSPSFLLVFRENSDALTYLNTHAGELATRFGVESIPGTQVAPLLKRWGFFGVGMVEDPLLPRVEFMRHEQVF